jgi:hypothetical protein
VPGNHNIGDNPWPGASLDSTVDPDRHEQWLDIVGADHWSLQLEGWTLLAINAQLLGSGLEAEGRQWLWLEERLSELSNDQQLAAAQPEFVEPDGIAQLTLLRDIPDPYIHS